MVHTSNKYSIHKTRLSNGSNIAYIDEGKGDTTLLFIHGLATYSQTWALNIAYLKDYYRCIAIDLPGNGHSDRGDFVYGINFFSGCIYDFMQQMKLKNVVLVGHSMGGQAALNLAINHPTACTKLVLCAPAGFETYTSMERTMFKSGIQFIDFFSTDENNLRSTIQNSFYNYPQKMEGMVKELVALMKTQPSTRYKKMIEACIHSMMDEPVYDGLKTIQQPVLVLFGEQDALIPNKLMHPVSTKALAEKAIKTMPDATLKMIPKCGHFLQLEQPDVTNQYIREFVN